MTGAILSEPAARRFRDAAASLRQAGWARKGLAYAIALAVNLALIGGFLLMSPSPRAEPDNAAPSKVVTVSIITAAQDVAPAEAAPGTDSPLAAAAPRSQNVERETAPAQRAARAEDETDAAPETPVLSVEAAPRDAPRASVALIEPGASEAAPDTAARSTLRSLACAQRLGRERPDPSCENAAPGFAWAAHIDPQAMAQVEQQVDAHVSGLGVLFGHRPPGDWPTGPYRAGDSVLAAPSRSLPASDGMRDRLPPMVPDPAFGD